MESLYSYIPLIIIFLACGLDYLIGDPKNWLHPVEVMGWFINFFTQLILKFFPDPIQRRLGGILLGIGIIFGSGILTWLFLQFIWDFSLWVGIIFCVILLASCFAGRSLRLATVDVLIPLTQGNLEKAREKLSQYVGRDTQNLTEKEILRAVLETVAENATDGVTAPLFYALIGLFVNPIFMVSLAIAYKASSTLDSMIGYQKEPFLDMGWFSAKFEDILTWFPCRLTVLTLALFSGKPKKTFQICQRDGIKDPSPNSGWSESVYAAILNVQLGGINTYQGVIKEKPLLGDDIDPITSEKIDQALQLTRNCCLIWLAIATIVFLVFNPEIIIR
jgi:adenosylcobinamide-phosphate synthase